MTAAGEEREHAEALAKRVRVGIVTALPEERAAMLAMFDRTCPWSFEGQGAGLVYDLGTLPAHGGGEHVVALALAGMGNNVAAARGTLLLQHFPDVEAIVMTGIAGGVPSPDKPDDHVRLGDVVVSGERGVIQYDFLKKTRKVTEVRASPRAPHARLLEAVRLLESDALAGAKSWERYVDRAKHLEGAARPEPARDVLLASHKPFERVEHPADRKRTDGQPRIFKGPIASGNVLLKDPVWRDRLRKQHGAKAVEMEGSGIADATWMHGVGYLVVRGICDYCDSQKNDDWHMYAAIVAAAYTRALLGRMAGGEKDEVGEDAVLTPGTSPLPKVAGPAARLNARHQVVPFHGRENVLEYMRRWCEDGDGVRVRLVHATGGMGKTRLAIEAVDIRRKLAESRPEVFLHYLAMSLNNLGSTQGELGHHKAALASTQEGVDIRRKLAESQKALLSNLATSLNSLGRRQSALGQHEAALDSAQEAVAIYRALAKSRPEACLPDFARSLNNLGLRQGALEHYEVALAATQEAVGIRRTLAKSRLEAFVPDLAMTLDNLGKWQSALGQHEAALASTEEALDAIWPFFLRLPAAFERNTGDCLGNLRKRLEALGQPPTAEFLQRIATFDTMCGTSPVGASSVV